jgi:hypothetical protein
MTEERPFDVGITVALFIGILLLIVIIIIT